MGKGWKLCEKYCPPDVDPTGFFFTCLVHGIDHYESVKAANPLFLAQRGVNHIDSIWVIRVLYAEPHRQVFMNSKMKNCKIPWVRKIYNGLHKFDPDKAGACEMGIRF